MTITVDIINGLFELLGGFFILYHCRVLFKAKAVSGVSIISTIFFNVWGCWNLYYYPTLEQWVSLFGGIFIVISNTVYVGMLIYYANYYKPQPCGHLFSYAPETTEEDFTKSCLDWVNCVDDEVDFDKFTKEIKND